MTSDSVVAEREEYSRRVRSGLLAIREGIERAASRARRDPASVEIVAVTKFHPLVAVEAAYDEGLRRFAENRVQEAEAKFPSLLASRPDIRLDMIGHLQGNKVNKALSLFDRIQSIDSLELLDAIITRRARMESSPGRALEILFELRTAEETKSGFPDTDAMMRACELLAERGDVADIVLKGLMTMAPLDQGLDATRASFSTLRQVFDRIHASMSFSGFDVLSMGMSGDYETAIEEGATEIRIGTALFGTRT